MRNVNGQIAKQWKNFQPKKGQTVQINVDPQYQLFVQKICKLIEQYSADLYGTANDLKYRYIVDLILDRTTSIVKDNYKNLIDKELNNIIVDIEKNLKTKNNNTNISENTQIISILNVIQQKIQEVLVEIKNSFKKELEVIFEEYRKEKIQNITDNEKTNDKNEQTEILKEETQEKETKEDDEEKENNDNQDNVSSYKKLVLNINNIFNNSIFVKLNNIYKQFQENDKNGFNFLKTIPIISETFKKINEKTFIPTTSNFEEIQNKLNQLQQTPKQKKQEKLFNEELIKNKDFILFLKKQINDIATIIFDSVGKILNKTIFVFAKFLAKALIMLVVPITALLIVPLLKFIIEPLLSLLTPLTIRIIDLIGSVVDSIKDLITELLQPVISFIIDTIGPPLKKLLDSSIDGIILVLQTIEPHIVEFMQLMFNLVFEVFDILNEFIKGIGTQAKELGIAIANLILTIASKIIKLFEGFSSNIEIIGLKIGEFILQIFEICKQFFLGIGDQAFNLGIAIGDFCEKLFDVLVNMFTGIENKTGKLGEDVALCINSLKMHMGEILSVFNIIVYKFITILDSITMFFKGIGVHAEKIGELYGLYLIEAAQIKRIILEQMAAKAQYIGKYLATKITQNFKNIQNYITQIKDLCGKNVDNEMSKDFQLMTKAGQILKNIDQKLYEILPSAISWDYGDYIDANSLSLGRGIIESMDDALEYSNDLRTMIWKSLDKTSINYKNDGYSQSIRTTEELIKFSNNNVFINLFQKILVLVQHGSSFIKDIKIQFNDLNDKRLNIQINAEKSPNNIQQISDKQIEQENIENTIAKDTITSKFINLFNIFDKIKQEEQHNNLTQSVKDSYDNIIKSISEQITVPAFNVPYSRVNYYNVANMENLNA